MPGVSFTSVFARFENVAASVPAARMESVEFVTAAGVEEGYP